MAYERDNIHRLDPYVPGEQPDATRVIKLNTNENPYPPSPQVMDAIASVSPERLRVYPPPLASGFRVAAAKAHGVGPSQVIATNGGDELLRLVITVFCEPSGPSGSGGVGTTTPSYSLYPVLAQIHDTPILHVPRGDGFALPIDLALQWNAAGCRVGLLVNPHAPTGKLETIETLREIATAFQGVLVVDEAYVDFAQGNAIDLVRDELPNVLLLRSMSKGYSLAGLRFGYGLGTADLIKSLDKARDSYNTDILSQAAATAALEDPEYAQRTWTQVIGQRTRLTGELRGRGWSVIDSQSNFVLATPPPDKQSAQAIYAALKARGILVRYFNHPRLDDKLRITIGTQAQVTKLLAELDAKGP
ncbi:MAG: histidinol-phosphate transaminase [Planctomycetota bacterium]